MISKNIIVSLLLCATINSLYGMLSYPGILGRPDTFFVVPKTSSHIITKKLRKHHHQSKLFRALYSYDAEKIKSLIQDGENVNEKDSNDTPFLWQIIDSRKHFNEKDILEIIDLLIEKGVELNVTVGNIQATVLHQTADYGLVLLLEKCIQAGADINAKNKYGNTPLIACLKSPHTLALQNKKQLVHLLLSHNADRNIKNYSDKMAYDYAKSDEIEEMLASKKPINAIATAMPKTYNNKIYEHLHIVLRCYPGPYKQLERKKPAE